MKKFKAHGVYVHVPFCKQKCFYCDFFSRVCGDNALMLQYADAVCRQIVENKMECCENATIYFGGGTPSIMPVEGIALIVNRLKECGCWLKPAEATIECNPGTVDMDKLQTYRQLGFDRISFGVQSFNDDELKAIGRIHNAEMALSAVDMAQKAGFKKISIDIIYGLPGQTLQSLEISLQRFSKLNLQHISVYGLILEAGTVLEKMVKNGAVVLPNEDVTADMYELVRDFLVQKHFGHYEISNYAVAGEESKHNLVYWNYLPYLGFGAGATGFDGFTRYTGITDVEKFCEVPGAVVVEKLTDENLYSEFMFMNLRKAEGVNLSEYAQRYDEDILAKTLQKVKDCIDKRLVIYDAEKNILRLTEKGMELGNFVFEKFV